ncbi:hypothetical protein ACTFIZ_006147 [Dictyostelium cf. discoideum]
MKLIISLLILICTLKLSFACEGDFNPTTANIGQCSASQTIGWLPAAPEYGTETLKVWTPEELSPEERDMHEHRMAYILAISKQTKRKFVSSIYAQNGTLLCHGVNTGKPNLMTHGEVAAINNCTALYNISIYTNMTLYTTGEPCTLCASALVWLDFKVVVWGTWNSYLMCKVCMGQIPMDSNYIFSRYYGVRSTPATLIGGVLRNETDAWFTPYCNNPASPFYVKPRCACYNSTSPLVVNQVSSSTWYEGPNNTKYSQFDGKILNNANYAVNNPTFTSSPSGVKPRTVWGLKNEGGDIWSLSYYPVISGNGGAFPFGYISTQEITFKAN